MVQSSHNGKGAFRINDWWWSKAALLMGMIYLFTLLFNISLKEFIPLSLFSLATIIGFASFGYLCNDFFDIEKDAEAGKKNFLAGKSFLLIITVFAIAGAFIFLPWWFLPKNKISLILIFTQLLLFALYSIPPVRLKERGVAGIVTDAFYAHSIPVLLAAYTYALAAGKPFFVPDFIFLFLWQSVSGVRNILLHQAEDIEADKISGVSNFVSGLSALQFTRLLKGLIATELLLCIVFFLILSINNPLFLIVALLVIALVLTDYRLISKLPNIEFLEGRQRFFPNGIYEKWLPPVFLFLLSFLNQWFLGVLVVHLALFNFDFYVQLFDKAYGQWKSVPVKGKFITFRIFISYPVNNAIYYTFRVFSVDLKKRNMSATAFLLAKFGLKPTNRDSG